MPNVILNEYGWKDIAIAVDGRIMAGARGVKFSEKIERELIYGITNNPLGVQDGNIDYSGELKILQSELEKLMAARGNLGLVTLRDLTITLSYVKLGKITTRTLVQVAITEIGEEFNQGDKFAEVTVPFIFTKVIYG